MNSHLKIVDSDGDSLVLASLDNGPGVIGYVQTNSQSEGIVNLTREHAVALRAALGELLGETVIEAAPEPEPKAFAPGDRVVRVGPHVKTDGDTYETESHLGDVATVTDDQRFVDVGDVRVRWDNSRVKWTDLSQIAASSLAHAPEPEPEPPVYSVGDRVLIVEDGPETEHGGNWRDDPSKPMRLYRSEALPLEATIVDTESHYSRPGDTIIETRLKNGSPLYVRACQIEPEPVAGVADLDRPSLPHAGLPCRDVGSGPEPRRLPQPSEGLRRRRRPSPPPRR